MDFKVVSPFEPMGDQQKAIDTLASGIVGGKRCQTLLGVTGSGKTYTMAKTIEKVNKPTLVIAHNKTLAGQLYSEFKEFFPDNAVEYFVSYYDYYQPEAYIPHTDTYIEKDASINDEIDKMRHSATSALFERRDVIIVASVSCIYGLGDPEDYKELMINLRTGMEYDRDALLLKLTEIRYERNDISRDRGTFAVRGDVVEIYPASTSEKAIRVEFFGDEIERICEIDITTGEITGFRRYIAIFPASHYSTTREKMKKAIVEIEKELDDRVKYFKENDKLLEMQRISQRTNYDIEMLTEIGFCQGIENYSRHISGRQAGSPPYTLIDYFPDDFLLIIDESHVTVGQIRAMYAGDKSRKDNLVNFGFRLPSAYDNRPLNFEEFENRINQVVFCSATPGDYEKMHSTGIAEQIIRPTGLVDPPVDVRPVKGQIDDLMEEIVNVTAKKQRVLVTTLTKRMAETLTNYLRDNGIKVKYLHSDIETIERMEIIRDLRLGLFDVLVGINLLREGLDIPEVSLVAILDADKEGFLRSETSLVQTIGRAARNADGRVIMYADNMTGSMQRAIDETNRRRAIQIEYNQKHGIVPKTVIKEIRDLVMTTDEDAKQSHESQLGIEDMTVEQKIANLTKLMNDAASNLEFEKAAHYRDEITKLKGEL